VRGNYTWSGGTGGSGVIKFRIASGITCTFSAGVTQSSSTAGGLTTYTITAAGSTDTVTFS
jgi:hypothetical protein